MYNKVYIHCSFNEKEEVKKLGAKWDSETKSWYIPEGVNVNLFSKWLSSPKGIPGIGGLYVDLVPKTCWFSNIRSVLSKNDWDLIRKKVYINSNHRCDICKGFGNSHPVEAHERWGFDWETKTQKLLKIESLCPACHQATHFGLAQVQGKGDIAFERLSYINGWTDQQTDNHIEKAFQVWEMRSKINTWKLDMSWLYNFIELDNETKKLIEDMKNGKIKRS